MAVAQQEQELQANRHRHPALVYKVGDQVWFKLTNAKRKDHTTKKLDWVNAKYTVTKVISPAVPAAKRWKTPVNRDS